MDYQKGAFTISTDHTKLNIPYIHQFLIRSYWAEEIPIEIVIKSIEGSVCFGLYENHRQIGFARVVTDKATFGYLADVFVDEEYRSRGLSKWLMEVIMTHPELQGFRSWMLGTKDAHGLYAQFGFTPLNQPERIMRKNVPNIYKNRS